MAPQNRKERPLACEDHAVKIWQSDKSSLTNLTLKVLAASFQDRSSYFIHNLTLSFIGGRLFCVRPLDEHFICSWPEAGWPSAAIGVRTQSKMYRG